MVGMRLAIIVLVVGLGSCTTTTVGQLQAGCETNSQSFPEMAACLRNAVASSDSTRMQNSPDVKLYLLKADQLAQRVQNKEISDLDARVELQQLYVNLRNQERINRAAGRPTTTNCYAVGNSVQCNTY